MHIPLCTLHHYKLSITALLAGLHAGLLAGIISVLKSASWLEVIRYLPFFFSELPCYVLALFLFLTAHKAVSREILKNFPALCCQSVFLGRTPGRIGLGHPHPPFCQSRLKIAFPEICLTFQIESTLRHAS